MHYLGRGRAPSFDQQFSPKVKRKHLRVAIIALLIIESQRAISGCISTAVLALESEKEVGISQGVQHEDGDPGGSITQVCCQWQWKETYIFFSLGYCVCTVPML